MPHQKWCYRKWPDPKRLDFSSLLLKHFSKKTKLKCFFFFPKLEVLIFILSLIPSANVFEWTFFCCRFYFLCLASNFIFLFIYSEKMTYNHITNAHMSTSDLKWKWKWKRESLRGGEKKKRYIIIRRLNYKLLWKNKKIK